MTKDSRVGEAGPRLRCLVCLKPIGPDEQRLVTMVVAAAVATAGGVHADDAADIRAFIEAYDRAFVAKNLGRLAAFYHPDVTTSNTTHGPRAAVMERNRC